MMSLAYGRIVIQTLLQKYAVVGLACSCGSQLLYIIYHPYLYLYLLIKDLSNPSPSINFSSISPFNFHKTPRNFINKLKQFSMKLLRDNHQVRHHNSRGPFHVWTLQKQACQDPNGAFRTSIEIPDAVCAIERPY